MKGNFSRTRLFLRQFQGVTIFFGTITIWAIATKPPSSHPKMVVKSRGIPPKWPNHPLLRIYNHKFPKCMVHLPTLINQKPLPLSTSTRHPVIQPSRFLFNAAVMGFSSSRGHRSKLWREQPKLSSRSWAQNSHQL